MNRGKNPASSLGPVRFILAFCRIPQDGNKTDSLAASEEATLNTQPLSRLPGVISEKQKTYISCL